MNFQTISENYVLRIYCGNWVNTYEPDAAGNIVVDDENDDSQFEIHADAQVAFYDNGKFDVRHTGGEMVTFVAYTRVDWDRVLSEEIAGG